MRSEGQRVGMAVREHHRIAKRYGTVGEVVGRYGGEEYLAVDVRFSDGTQRLFWPGDLEEARSSSQPSWWLLCSASLGTSQGTVFTGTGGGVFSVVRLLFNESCGG